MTAAVTSVSAVTPRLATLVTLARWPRARRGVVTVAVTAVTRLARHVRTVGMGPSRRRDRHRDLRVRAGRDRRDSPRYSRSDGGLGPTAGAVITVIITGALALRAPRLVHRARSPGDHLWLISVVHLAAA